MLKDTLKEKGYFLPEGFSVGYASAVINPPNGVSMAGYGVANAKVRLTTENWEDLKVLCAAWSDGENLLLTCTFDTCQIAESVARPVLRTLEEEIGIPEENVIFNVIHTHAAPTMYTTSAAWPGVPEYQQNVFYPALVRAAKEAVRDLAPATLSLGRGKTENLSYVRRYLLSDGTYRTNPRGDDVPVAHETGHDETMQVVRIHREGKKDLVIINWQCHPTSAGGAQYTNTSPDWVGILRDRVEEKFDVYCMFHQGAAGNIVASGKLPGEEKFGRDRYVEHGEKIAEVAFSILSSPMAPLATGKVQATKKMISLVQKEDESKTSNIPISALSMGQLSFATVPYEMFSANGEWIKANTPFDVTFVCENTNGNYNYVPAKESYSHGSYEVRICPFAMGSAEIVAEELVNMLKNQSQNA